MDGWALLDGKGVPLSNATVPITDVGFTHGFSIFETLLAGQDPAANLARLRASGSATGIEVPEDSILRAEIETMRQRMGDDAVVRITITGDGRRVVWATPSDPTRRHRPVRCVTGPHVDSAHVDGSVKHRSRMGWLAAVRRSGADEMLLVDADGRFTEGTTCAVLAVVGGILHTAPWDGRILRSTTLQRLLDHASTVCIPVVRQGAPSAGPFDALYIASTTRHLAPVISLDGRPLPGWDPIGRQLQQA